MKPAFFAAAACCLFVLFQDVSLAHPDDPPIKNEKKQLTDLKPKFTISKETTYALGPVKADGYIDYIEALNDLCRKGVTVENNANVPLFHAIGPMFYPELHNEYCKRLGIPTLSKQDDQFIPWDKFFKVPSGDEAARDKAYALQERITKRPWSAAEFPKAAEWVKVNAKAAELMHEASHRSRYYSPYVTHKTSDPIDTSLFGLLLPMTIKGRELCDLLLSRAMLRTHEGKFEEAQQDLMVCHRLGRLVGQGGILIEQLTGMALDQLATNTDLALISDERVDATKLERFQSEIKNLSPFPGIAEVMDKGDRMQCINITVLVAQQGLPLLERFAPFGTSKELGLATKIANRFYFNNLPWDPALKETNAWYDRLVAILKIEDTHKRLAELHRLDDELKEQRLGYSVKFGSALLESGAKPEDRARLLAEMTRLLLVPASLKVQMAAYRREQQQRNLQVAIALELYRRAHHKYPDKLAELSPNYLQVITNDMYTSRDLIYRKTDKGYLLYSVGPNGKDDGGRTREDDPACDDIVIRMPLPELKAEGK